MNPKVVCCTGDTIGAFLLTESKCPKYSVHVIRVFVPNAFGLNTKPEILGRTIAYFPFTARGVFYTTWTS
jgi:hypothetical protein